MCMSGSVIIHLIIFLHSTDWCQTIQMCTLYSQWYRPISLNWDKFQFRCCQGSDSAQIKSSPTITNTLNISIFLTQWQLNWNVVFKSSETFRFIPQQTSHLIVDWGWICCHPCVVGSNHKQVCTWIRPVYIWCLMWLEDDKQGRWADCCKCASFGG